MSYSIFDIHLNYLSGRVDRSTAYTVNAVFSHSEPKDDDIMVSDSPQGTYILKSSLYPNMADLDYLYPYQVLLPALKEANALIIDRLNGANVILSARVNGAYVASTAYEKDPDDAVIRLFLAKHDLPVDTVQESVTAYVKPKKVTPFEEVEDRAFSRAQKRRDNITMVIAVLTAVIGVYLFAVSFVQFTLLSRTKKTISAEIAVLNAKIPSGNLTILELLDRDDMLLVYIERIIRLKPSGIISVTPEGIVFRSYEPLEVLKRKEHTVKAMDTSNFFLLADSFTIPGDSKR